MTSTKGHTVKSQSVRLSVCDIFEIDRIEYCNIPGEYRLKNLYVDSLMYPKGIHHLNPFYLGKFFRSGKFFVSGKIFGLGKFMVR